MKKVSANKVSVELNNMANNLNNNVKRVVKNEMAINLIRVLIILYTSFVIPVLDRRTLDLLNNNVVRLVLCALIVYLAFMDVVTSVLLTIAFVLTIHQGRKRSEQSNNNSVNDAINIVMSMFFLKYKLINIHNETKTTTNIIDNIIIVWILFIS